MVEISEMGTLRPDESANEPPIGVEGKAELCCVPGMGGTPKFARLALEEVGVRPGTASKKSPLPGDGVL